MELKLPHTESGLRGSFMRLKNTFHLSKSESGIKKMNVKGAYVDIRSLGKSTLDLHFNHPRSVLSVVDVTFTDPTYCTSFLVHLSFSYFRIVGLVLRQIFWDKNQRCHFSWIKTSLIESAFKLWCYVHAQYRWYLFKDFPQLYFISFCGRSSKWEAIVTQF